MLYIFCCLGIRVTSNYTYHTRSTFVGVCMTAQILKEEAKETTLEECAGRLRRCTTVGQMPMQNHMRAKIHGNDSISCAWIFAPCLCLAPVRRKMFMSYVWIFALLLLHMRISVQNLSCYYPSFNFSTHFLLLENYLHSKARTVTYKMTPALHTDICWEFFSCA